MLTTEGIYVEVPSKDAADVVSSAVDAVGLRVVRWVVDEETTHQGDRTGFVVRPPAPFDDPREAYRISYELRTELQRSGTSGSVLVEPLFEEAPTPTREAAIEESALFSTPPVAPPGWHLAFARVPPGVADGIRVGHPDTGYTHHPSIEASIRAAQGADYVDGDDPLDTRDVGPLWFPLHGTRTASVIAARWVEQPAFLGVAPGAEIIPIRVSRSVIVLSQWKLAKAIRHAVDMHCDVISISMGGLPHTLLRRACEYAAAHGVIVACAAGNKVGLVVWPARYPTTLAVAACTVDAERWPESSHGDAVDVTAPGADIQVATWTGDAGETPSTEQSSGTSFAVAMVAGAAARWIHLHGRDALRARYGNRLPDAFREALRASVEPHALAGMGTGFLDVTHLLALPLPALTSPSVNEAAFREAVASPVGSPAFEGFDAADLPHLARALHTTDSELGGALADVGDELRVHLVAVDGAQRALREGRLADALADVASARLAGWLRGSSAERALLEPIAPGALSEAGAVVTIEVPLHITVQIDEPFKRG